MKAVILAGGIGTRMRPLTYVIPKAMLPIGGKPLLEHMVRYLKEYGITEVIVCVAYLKNHIMDYFKDGKSLKAKIQYAEADMPLGTAGQLKTAEKYISETFLAMNGDIITSLNLRRLIDFHEEAGGIGTIALKKFEVPIPYGYIEVDDNLNIRKFTEKPTLTFSANAGIYVLEPKIFNYIPKDQVVSLETETFPTLLKNGERLNGYYEDAYWADVGTITDFERVDKELLSKFYAQTGTEVRP
jgi:NDP-sugar pyrophosphorylase family protein